MDALDSTLGPILIAVVSKCSHTHCLPNLTWIICAFPVNTYLFGIGVYQYALYLSSGAVQSILESSLSLTFERLP